MTDNLESGQDIPTEGRDRLLDEINFLYEIQGRLLSVFASTRVPGAATGYPSLDEAGEEALEMWALRRDLERRLAEAARLADDLRAVIDERNAIIDRDAVQAALWLTRLPLVRSPHLRRAGSWLRARLRGR